MVMTYNLIVNDIWDVWEASVLGHSFDVFSVFQRVCNFKCLGFLVIILQLGESKFHTFNVGVKTLNNYFVLERVPKLAQLGKNSRSAYKDLVKTRELVRQKARYPGQSGL